MQTAEDLLEGLAERGQTRGRCAYVALMQLVSMSLQPTSYRRVGHVVTQIARVRVPTSP